MRILELIFFQVDDIEEKLDRLITLYEEDRKRFPSMTFASPHCPPCTPTVASSPSPPFAGGACQSHHLPINQSSTVRREKSCQVTNGSFSIYIDTLRQGMPKLCFAELENM